jgi:acetyltransferase-like isoleucine patch superfamily enzyme
MFRKARNFWHRKFGNVRMDLNPYYTAYEIGRYTYGRPSITAYRGEPATLRVGAFCSIAGGVKILLGGNHHSEWVSTYPFSRHFAKDANLPVTSFTRGDVIIGNDVWIATDVMIQSGTTIGDGAIIAAGAVVVGDVPPYAMYGGVPAKLIRYRFSKEQIAALLQMAWWHWPDEKIRQELPFMLSPKIDEFIARHLKDLQSRSESDVSSIRSGSRGEGQVIGSEGFAKSGTF